MKRSFAYIAIVGACLCTATAQAQTEITVMDNQRLRLEVHRALEPVCEANIGSVDIRPRRG